MCAKLMNRNSMLPLFTPPTKRPNQIKGQLELLLSSMPYSSFKETFLLHQLTCYFVTCSKICTAALFCFFRLWGCMMLSFTVIIANDNAVYPSAAKLKTIHNLLQHISQTLQYIFPSSFQISGRQRHDLIRQRI